MQSRKYVIFIILLLLVVVLLNLPGGATRALKGGVRDNVSPFHRFVALLSNHSHGVLWHLSGLWGGAGTERELQSEIARLRQQVWRLRRLEEDNRNLLDKFLERTNI